jgi:hypothetical protein
MFIAPVQLYLLPQETEDLLPALKRRARTDGCGADRAAGIGKAQRICMGRTAQDFGGKACCKIVACTGGVDGLNAAGRQGN